MKAQISILALCLLLIGSEIFAKQVSPQGGSELRLPHKERNAASEDVIKQFEAPDLGSYRLDDGDQISVDVWGRPELSGKHLIGPDGQITLPVAGPIVVSGKSREETEQTIKNSLSKYYADLAVTVRVDQYSSFRVMMLGRVGVPGALTFDRQPTLLDALTKAAGLPIGGGTSQNTALVRCAIFRGVDKVIWIDLQPLLVQGNLAYNIRLARNDVIYLPDANDRLVYVLGDVKTPGAVHLTPAMSLLDALSLAGGPTEDASLSHMAFIRPSIGKQVEIPMKTLLEGAGRANYSLEEGDILYVPPRGLAKFGYVMQKISPITAFAILGSVARP